MSVLLMRRSMSARRVSAAVGVEIFGRSQRSNALARRPFAIEHGKPGIVAIAALDDHVLRNVPSNVKPYRSAARRDAALSALHFHS